jgi:hypothetical protein
LTTVSTNRSRNRVLHTGRSVCAFMAYSSSPALWNRLVLRFAGHRVRDRMAVGAQQSAILRMVLGQGFA